MPLSPPKSRQPSMSRGVRFVIRGAVIAMLGLGAGVWAQRRMAGPRFHAPARAYAQHPYRRPAYRAPARRGPNFRGGQPKLGLGLAKLARIPPGQRLRRLRQDPNFRRLPAWRRKQIVRQLRWFNSLPPRRQRQVLARLRMLGRMTPRQRRQMRRIFQRWQRLPVPRRAHLARAFQRIMHLPPWRRRRLLNNPNFRRQFPAPDFQMLRHAVALQSQQ